MSRVIIRCATVEGNNPHTHTHNQKKKKKKKKKKRVTDLLLDT